MWNSISLNKRLDTVVQCPHVVPKKVTYCHIYVTLCIENIEIYCIEGIIINCWLIIFTNTLLFIYFLKMYQHIIILIFFAGE